VGDILTEKRGEIGLLIINPPHQFKQGRNREGLNLAFRRNLSNAGQTASDSVKGERRNYVSLCLVPQPIAGALESEIVTAKGKVPIKKIKNGKTGSMGQKRNYQKTKGESEQPKRRATRR